MPQYMYAVGDNVSVCSLCPIQWNLEMSSVHQAGWQVPFLAQSFAYFVTFLFPPSLVLFLSLLILPSSSLLRTLCPSNLRTSLSLTANSKVLKTWKKIHTFLEFLKVTHFYREKSLFTLSPESFHSLHLLIWGRNCSGSLKTCNFINDGNHSFPQDPKYNEDL